MPLSSSGFPQPYGLEALRTYGEGFAGRQADLAALDRAWAEGVRVFVLHAQGGAGKTRVVAKWLTQVRDDGWRGAGRVFVHSFYSQGSDERRNASSEVFFEEALAYFGHSGPPLTDPGEKGRTLARLMGERRGLLVLDGLEPLQHPPAFDQGRLKDPAIHSLLQALASGWLGEAAPRGLCLVTSRQPIVELESKTGRVVVQQLLDRLDPEAGAELLRQLEVAGPEGELRQASEELRGHAYTLMLLGTYLRDATPDHEIRRRTEIPLLQEDAEHGRHARHLFAAYVRHLGESSPEVAVLRLLGFFDRPAEERLMAALREAPPAEESPELADLVAPLRSLSKADWRRVLRRLSELRLIDLPAGPAPEVDAHPLLRETFAEQVRTGFPAAWQAGHRLLFEFLCMSTKRWPDTLPGLQPLYQAVAHGCLAGLYQQALVDVYRDRILRGTGFDGFYASRKLGAIGAGLAALASFFTEPWTMLAPNLEPDAQAWLLGEASSHLQALGRLTEAVEPMRIGVRSELDRSDWSNAAVSLGKMCSLQLTKGELQAALAAGQQAITLADRSGEVSQQVSRRAALADALHQSGQSAESLVFFEDAEALQAMDQPEHPRLYSVRGFRYCDLLLGQAERDAWQRWLSGGTRLHQDRGVSVAVCEAVTERAVTELQRRLDLPTSSLLDLALAHLVLARAALYLADFEVPLPLLIYQNMDAATVGFRAASQMEYLLRGLLTRAWVLCLSNDETGARDDIDEAWEIAERGPMPLFQADIQLTRARLFRDLAALAEARRLIEKHGYHRRDEELADAEAAARTWNLAPRPPLPSPSLPPGEGGQAPKDGGSMRDQVFISYSHKDEKPMKDLLVHLKPHQRAGISTWSDKQIASGSRWFAEIQTALGKTSVAVLLVSPDFLASDFIHEHELGPLLKEAKAGGVRILWIPLRSSAYEETPLKDLQAVSSPDKPLAQMSKADRDEAWVRVCKEIKAALKP